MRCLKLVELSAQILGLLQATGETALLQFEVQGWGLSTPYVWSEIYTSCSGTVVPLKK